MSRLVITDQEAERFARDGYLVIRGGLEPAELARMQEATMKLLEGASPDLGPDYVYGVGRQSGKPKLQRIEYLVDKQPAARVLMGNPFVLRTVEKLMGPDLIPTWDSMVLKFPGEGIIVPWHRDSGSVQVGDRPIFNVDFYLDPAGESNCVWAVPGSHIWDDEETAAWLGEHAGADVTSEDFRRSGAVPALMAPGDILLHNILVLHGSPATTSEQLRRVVYYEFRTAHVEQEIGPHAPQYIPLKQRLLLACMRLRKQADYISADETPYEYAPPPPFAVPAASADEEPTLYRYPHEKYWRSIN